MKDLLDQTLELDELKTRVREMFASGMGLRQFLETPGIVQQLRVNLMKFEGSQGIVKLASFIDELQRAGNDSYLAPEPASSYTANLAYFMPSAFWSAFPHYFSTSVRNFDANESAIFFASETSAAEFFEQVQQGHIKIGELSPSFLLMAALAATVRLPNDRSRQVLELLRNNAPATDNRYRLVRHAITARLTHHLQPRPERHGGKTAVIVAGQLRGADTALPAVMKGIDLPDADSYLSTWGAQGVTTIDRARLSRVFTPEALSLAESLTNEQLGCLNLMHTRASAIDPDALLQKVLALVPGLQPGRVQIFDDRLPVFTAMPNGVKMHYHNMVWPRLLGPGVLADSYDYVIKVRPDIRVGVCLPISLDTLRGLAPQQIGDDHPTWLLEPWGFGMGDQLFYGRSDVMEKLLNIWTDNSVSTQIMSVVLGRPAPLQGHMNLGLELWMLGGEPTAMPLTKKGLAAPDRISLDQLQKMISLLKEDA